MFTKPVDTEEVPDYTQIIKQPMDLETMMTKVDFHRYECAKDFLNDIELICQNALEYNPAKYVCSSHHMNVFIIYFFPTGLLSISRSGIGLALSVIMLIH